MPLEHSYVAFEPLPAEAKEILIISLNGTIVFSQLVDGSQTRRWEWPVVNNNNEKLASGFYIYIIKGSGDKKLISGKLGVIR